MATDYAPKDLPSHLRLYIGGEWVDATGGATFDVLDLDDLCAHVGKELGAERSRAVLLDGEDAHVAKGQGGIHEYWRCAETAFRESSTDGG